MCSGVRKSGWPMPRLTMSRPCAASAVARASTAKAFSSPIRSKAEIVFSMRFPACVIRAEPFSEADLRHPHHFKDDGNGPSDQQEPVERHHRPDQPPAFGGDNVAIAQRHIILEGEFEAGEVRRRNIGESQKSRPEPDF